MEHEPQKLSRLRARTYQTLEILKREVEGRRSNVLNGMELYPCDMFGKQIKDYNATLRVLDYEIHRKRQEEEAEKRRKEEQRKEMLMRDERHRHHNEQEQRRQHEQKLRQMSQTQGGDKDVN
jgi:uncharacterized membrane protein YukC